MRFALATAALAVATPSGRDPSVVSAATTAKATELQQRHRRSLMSAAASQASASGQGRQGPVKQTIFPQCDPDRHETLSISTTKRGGNDEEKEEEQRQGQQQQHPNRRLRNSNNGGGISATTITAIAARTNHPPADAAAVVVADVGVLSCGAGQYCVETANLEMFSSSLAPPLVEGICVDHDIIVGEDKGESLPQPPSSSSSLDSSAKIRLQQHHAGAGTAPRLLKTHRALQTGDDDDDDDETTTASSLLQVMYDLCYTATNTSDASVFDECECTDMDVDSYSGRIVCSYFNSCFNSTTFCGDDLQFCFDQTYSLVVTGPAEDGAGGGVLREASVCGHLKSKDTSPSATSTSSPVQVVDFQYCYDVLTNDTATVCTSMTINDDQECSSCAFPIGDGHSRVCTQVTCGETDFQFSGNFCEQSVKDVYLEYNVLAPQVLPCPNGGCNLCGEGTDVFMSNPNGVLVLGEGSPLSGAFYGCGQIEVAALTGTFDEATCLYLETAAADPCGCFPPPLSDIVIAPLEADNDGADDVDGADNDGTVDVGDGGTAGEDGGPQ
jgi:hypothetical protein